MIAVKADDPEPEMTEPQTEDPENPENVENVEVPTRTLVEAMTREDGTVDAGELYAVAGVLGMSDQQVRLCVKRLVAEGRYLHVGRGRKAVLRATAATRRAMAPHAEFVRHAFLQDVGRAPWHGLWHLVAFAVPESARPGRDALREAILRLGGAPIQGGLYVSANDWDEFIRIEADRLGLRERVTLMTTGDLRIGDEDDARRLAARLWPLDEIAARYARLAAVTRPRLDRLRAPGGPTDRERLTIGIELAAEFTRAIEPDPLLPPELLPRPWQGARARALLAGAWLLLEPPDGQETGPALFGRYDDVLGDVVREAAAMAPG